MLILVCSHFGKADDNKWNGHTKIKVNPSQRFVVTSVSERLSYICVVSPHSPFLTVAHDTPVRLARLSSSSSFHASASLVNQR
jgi:hypothetical protein